MDQNKIKSILEGLKTYTCKKCGSKVPYDYYVERLPRESLCEDCYYEEIFKPNKE